MADERGTQVRHDGEALRQIITSVIGCEVANLPHEVDLMEAGIIDSLDLLQIAHEMSVHLDRDIPREVVVECRFKSGLEHWIEVFERQLESDDGSLG